MTLQTKATAIMAGIASLGLMGIAGAHAATLTTSGSFGPVTPPGSTSVTLNKFNTALGTLNSVTLTLAGNFSVTLRVENQNNNTVTFTSASAFLTSGLDAIGPDGTDVNASPSLVVNNANGYTVSDRTLTALQVKTYSNTVSATNSATVTGAGLANYQGPGTGTFLVTVNTSDIFAGGSGAQNVQYSATGTVAGTVTAVYNYTATGSAAPEPGSFVLAGMGLVSMGGLAVRRRKSA